MKKTTRIALSIAITAFLPLATQAAVFSSGSTGADGPLNVTSNVTLQIPPGGIFNFTTITIAAGQTLSFSNNVLNTPVYLLATGDVLITGTISVNGARSSDGQYWIGGIGGPGGFNGGYGGQPFNQTAGRGLGPGGGLGGSGVGLYGTNYGNALLSPLVGGSGGTGNGGSPERGGSGGGGAILIASSTQVILDGLVSSRGGDYPNDYYNSPGSGGAVRLVSPRVSGTGDIDCGGGFSYNPGANYFGGPGRARIDCTDREAFRAINFQNGTLATRGSQMFVFPTVMTYLDIIQAAGQNIPQGAASGAMVNLPVTASTNQTVIVQARNFTNSVPITVVVTPENGASSNYTATILQSSGSPPKVTVNVVIPAGIVTRINAWTR